MRYPLILVLLACQLNLLAQTSTQGNETDLQNSQVILVNPNGSVFLPGKYSTITTGSAFYTEEFYPAILFFPGNKATRAKKIRLDLLANTIHFINEQQEEMVVTQPVEKVILERADNTREVFVHGSTLPTENTNYKKAWFQVIQQQDITVYKLYFKTIQENKPFNSGVIEKNIETYEKYFIIREGKLSPSKKPR